MSPLGMKENPLSNPPVTLPMVFALGTWAWFASFLTPAMKGASTSARYTQLSPGTGFHVSGTMEDGIGLLLDLILIYAVVMFIQDLGKVRKYRMWAKDNMR